MTNTKHTKKALTASLLSMLLCVAMLVGSTFAWFTDTASTKVNSIISGTLDVELVNKNNHPLDKETPLNFVKADAGKDEAILWEPGVTYALEPFKIVNNGSLWLKYKVEVNKGETKKGTEDSDKNLLDVIDFYVIEGQVNGKPDLKNATKLDDYFAKTTTPKTLEPKGETKLLTIVGHMQETAGNAYQGLTLDGIGITVYATQYTAEHDSYDNQYDKDAEYLAWDGSKDEEGLGNNTNSTEKTVTIASAEQLAAFAEAVNAGNSYAGYTVTLDANIDLLGTEWTPIGRNSKPFSGTFDGNGKTISNLYIDEAGKSDVGLFGFTTNGEVKNLTVHNATVKGYLDVGAIAGTPYTSKYTNIKLIGEIKVEGYAYVGGMFGKNAYANLTNLTLDASETSYVKAESENYRTYVGGIVGFMGEGGHKVTNAVSNIDVFGSTCDVGGITGIAHYGNSFINCSSSGNVTLTGANDSGDELEIGGIAGVWHNQTGQTVTFENCSYTGTLSSYNKRTDTTVTEFQNNGLVGRAYSTSGTGTLIIR